MFSARWIKGKKYYMLFLHIYKYNLGFFMIMILIVKIDNTDEFEFSDKIIILKKVKSLRQLK